MSPLFQNTCNTDCFIISISGPDVRGLLGEGSEGGMLLCCVCFFLDSSMYGGLRLTLMLRSMEVYIIAIMHSLLILPGGCILPLEQYVAELIFAAFPTKALSTISLALVDSPGTYCLLFFVHRVLLSVPVVDHNGFNTNPVSKLDSTFIQALEPSERKSERVL